MLLNKAPSPDKFRDNFFNFPLTPGQKTRARLRTAKNRARASEG